MTANGSAATPAAAPTSGRGQAAREARFGTLPERVAFQDQVCEQPATAANQAVDAYDPDGLGARFSCLAADLGL
ncbi:MAG: hypothetical protein HOV87_24790 [Catenulispora sp.]|nr:hypothetical protein [Catenulispora sp.]